MRVGVWFYGLATVVTGILDIVWGGFEASHQPIKALRPACSWPAGTRVYRWCVAGRGRRGDLVATDRTDRGSGISHDLPYLCACSGCLDSMLCTPCFGFRHRCLDFHLVRHCSTGDVGRAWSSSFMPTTTSDPVWRERQLSRARWMLGLSPIVFGLGHLINRAGYVRFVPHWVPFASFWIVLTGIAFLLAGSAIVSGIRDLLAARLLALMLLLFESW